MTNDSFWPSTRLTLLERLRTGEDSNRSWTQFVDLYAPPMYRVCRRCKLPLPDTADVTQEVFLRIFNGIKTFEYDPNGSFARWVGRILRNEISRFVKNHRKRLMLEMTTDPLDALTMNLEEEWLAEEQKELAAHAIETFGRDNESRDWTIFKLTAIDGKTTKEVIEILGVDAAQVYRARYATAQQLKHLVARLRSELSRRP